MKTVRFDCNGHNAPAYSCSEPGDWSGTYVKATDYAELEAEAERYRIALEEIITYPLKADGPRSIAKFALSIEETKTELL